jgi:hypothetical protein
MIFHPQCLSIPGMRVTADYSFVIFFLFRWTPSKWLRTPFASSSTSTTRGSRRGLAFGYLLFSLHPSRRFVSHYFSSIFSSHLVLWQPIFLQFQQLLNQKMLLDISLKVDFAFSIVCSCQIPSLNNSS